MDSNTVRPSPSPPVRLVRQSPPARVPTQSHSHPAVPPLTSPTSDRQTSRPSRLRQHAGHLVRLVQLSRIPSQLFRLPPAAVLAPVTGGASRRPSTSTLRIVRPDRRDPPTRETGDGVSRLPHADDNQHLRQFLAAGYTATITVTNAVGEEGDCLPVRSPSRSAWPPRPATSRTTTPAPSPSSTSPTTVSSRPSRSATTPRGVAVSRRRQVFVAD